MRETTLQRTQRYVALSFMVLVTAVLLALVVEQASHGLEGLPGMVVYALMVGFGLEFVTSVWSGGGHRAGSGRRLKR